MKSTQIPDDKIPVRGSSKPSKRPRDFEKEFEQCQRQERQAQFELESERKRLKTAGSFDHPYWRQRATFTEKQIELNQVVRKMSVAEFVLRGVGDESAWMDSVEARKSMEIEAALKIEQKAYQKQAARQQVIPDNEEHAQRKYFMRLFATSKRGLNIQSDQTGLGQRDRKIQSRFRRKLIKACKPQNRDKRSQTFWCPILEVYAPEPRVRACHIFPRSAGQEDMDAIFGREDPDRREMNEIENGLMMTEDVEDMIDNGKLLIVPHISPNASTDEMNAWLLSSPKSYMIRILDPQHEEMQYYYPYQIEKPEKTWAQLDSRQIFFRTTHRPRARYLYYQYCVTMLRRSWITAPQGETILKGELGQQYWGTRGPFMKKKMLLAMVEEMGHDYEDLLQGAAPPDKQEDEHPDDTGLLCAISTIIASASKDSEQEEESGDEGAEDEGDEDEGDEDEGDEDEGDEDEGGEDEYAPEY